MEKQKINTGILSFGMSGRVFHAPFVHTNDHFNFTAVVERTKKAAKEIYPDVRSYDSVTDLLADDSIELVIVNTPNYTHFEFAKASLEAGKHVLLEKPAVDDLDQLEKLTEISEKTGKKIFFYQNRRYDSHFMQVKEIIRGWISTTSTPRRTSSPASPTTPRRRATCCRTSSPPSAATS